MRRISSSHDACPSVTSGVVSIAGVLAHPGNTHNSLNYSRVTPSTSLQKSQLIRESKQSGAVELWRGHPWNAPGCRHPILKILPGDQALSIVVCLLCGSSKEVPHGHLLLCVRGMGAQRRP